MKYYYVFWCIRVFNDDDEDDNNACQLHHRKKKQRKRRCSLIIQLPSHRSIYDFNAFLSESEHITVSFTFIIQHNRIIYPNRHENRF